MQITPLSAAPTAGVSADARALHVQAQELEAVFLSEMLASAGLGTTSQDFGGGIGEAQFASFLRLEQARQMVQSGGIGLTESIVRALTAARHD